MKQRYDFIAADFNNQYGDPSFCPGTQVIKRNNLFPNRNIMVWGWGYIGPSSIERIGRIKMPILNGQVINEGIWSSGAYRIIKNSIQDGKFQSASIEIEIF